MSSHISSATSNIRTIPQLVLKVDWQHPWHKDDTERKPVKLRLFCFFRKTAFFNFKLGDLFAFHDDAAYEIDDSADVWTCSPCGRALDCGSTRAKKIAYQAGGCGKIGGGQKGKRREG